MKNGKLTKMVRDILDEYGDLQMLADERAPIGALYILGPDDDGAYVLKGSVVNINRARDIRNSVFVPELYSGEESTWA